MMSPEFAGPVNRFAHLLAGLVVAGKAGLGDLRPGSEILPEFFKFPVIRGGPVLRPGGHLAGLCGAVALVGRADRWAIR